MGRNIMNKRFFAVFFLIVIIISGIAVYIHIETTKPDPELNKKFSPYGGEDIYPYYDSQYYKYYENKFENLPIDTVLLSMGLHWFVDSYDKVYTGKTDVFYEHGFDGSPNRMTKDLLALYNTDSEKYYYLKPLLDCYLLMNEDYKPSEEELETIKETILYALDYYINGKDFIGTLEPIY